jgi:hypothetical protein
MATSCGWHNTRTATEDSYPYTRTVVELLGFETMPLAFNCLTSRVQFAGGVLSRGHDATQIASLKLNMGFDLNGLGAILELPIGAVHALLLSGSFTFELSIISFETTEYAQKYSNDLPSLTSSPQGAPWWSRKCISNLYVSS